MARFFKDSEIEGLDPDFVKLLDLARSVAGVPFIITSGRRSATSNERAMGVENSAHLTGLAVDLRADNSVDRFHILNGLFIAGFTRIGIYNHHIHVDSDDSKPNPVCWFGGQSHA